ncbi:MAG: cache domain-containing protein [Desulfovibrio sp.]|nr:cache domain-containing protein [Desulfovibrio sp.]
MMGRLKEIRARTAEALAVAICREHHFATHMDGVEMLFADRSELEGMHLLHVQDDSGRFVIQDMVRLAREQGQGFYEYTWTKPDVQGSPHRKIAFIQYVRPLDWRSASCWIVTTAGSSPMWRRFLPSVLPRRARRCRQFP